MEWHRVAHSPRTWVAAMFGVALSFLGLHVYTSLNFQDQVPSAWVGIGYSTLYLSPFLPLVGAVAFGDWLAGDAESAFLACTVTRTGLPRMLYRSSLTALLGTALLIVVSLIPATMMSIVLFPVAPGPLAGALSGYHAPEWIFTLANVGTLTLAGACWTTVAMLVTPLILPNRYWVVGVPVIVYLLLGVLLPPTYNPMRRSDLWFYQPTVGAFWTDPLVWVGLLIVGGLIGGSLWLRKGDLLG